MTALALLWLGAIAWGIACYCLIAKKAGYSGWWGLVMLIPFAGIIVAWIFPFIEWPIFAKSRSGLPQPNPRTGNHQPTHASSLAKPPATSIPRSSTSVTSHSHQPANVPAGNQPGVATSPVHSTTASLLNSTMIDEDAIYATIAGELETGGTDKGLWTRLFAECDGDENRTKVAYIKQRAEKLKAIELAHYAEIARQRNEDTKKTDELRQAIMAVRRENLSLFKNTQEQARALLDTEKAKLLMHYVRFTNFAPAEALLTEMPLLVAVWNGCGDTPLHVAALEQDTKMVRLLLERGAPIGQANIYGHTPMSLARNTGNQELIDLLSAVPEFAETVESDPRTGENLVAKCCPNCRMMHERSHMTCVRCGAALLA